MQKPLIFITNDDGFEAQGINELIDRVSKFARIIAVAPENAQSGMSHAITMGHPLYVRTVRDEEDVKVISCSGTPVDCVKLAFDSLLEERPVLALSGINHGSNSAISVIYSGTMGAAAECSYYKIPAIGLSLLDHSTTADFSGSLHYAEIIIKRVLEQIDSIKLPFCLNVNFPKVPVNEILGVKMCRQNRGVWIESFERRQDPRGRDYYWLKGYYNDHEKGEVKDTDEWALSNNYVSIVPVEMSDMTDYKQLEVLKQWKF